MSWVDTFKKNTGSSEDEGPLDDLCTGFVLFCMLVSLVILVVGVIGNATICYVVVRVKSMRSSVNYYLFSLALADILNSATWIVFATIWYFEFLSPEIREAVWNLHDAITSVNSNLTLTALTLNRYVAICFPLRARYVTTESRTIKVISAIWIFSFYYYTAYHLLKLMLCDSKEDAFCRSVRFIFSDTVYVLLFLALPLLTITVSYTLIGLAIWSSSRGFQNCSERRTSAKRGLKLSIAAILEFLVCSIPCQLVQISGLVFPQFLRTTSGHALFFFTKILSLGSTVIDPIIYSAVSIKFRKAFQDLYSPSARETFSVKHLDVSPGGTTGDHVGDGGQVI